MPCYVDWGGGGGLRLYTVDHVDLPAGLKLLSNHLIPLRMHDKKLMDYLPGGGALLRCMLCRIWMCGRSFQILTFCRPKFRQNFLPFTDIWRKICLCIIENTS